MNGNGNKASRPRPKGSGARLAPLRSAVPPEPVPIRTMNQILKNAENARKRRQAEIQRRKNAENARKKREAEMRRMETNALMALMSLRNNGRPTRSSARLAKPSRQEKQLLELLANFQRGVTNRKPTKMRVANLHR